MRHIYIGLAFSLLTSFLAAQEVDSEDLKAKRAAQLKKMRAQADRFEFSFVKKTEKIAINPQPIMRYADPPRGFLDATVWIWEVDGLPIAVGKIEDVHRSNGRIFWNHCVASLSEDLIKMTGPDSRRWTARTAGVKFESISDGPEPSKSIVGRLRQLKTLSKRFECTTTNTIRDTQQELRILPQPVHRFAHEATGIVDGVIFGMASNGTNPSILLLITLNDSKSGDADWKYAAVGVTADKISLRLDEKEVWTRLSAEETSFKQFQDNWFFYSHPKSKTKNK